MHKMHDRSKRNTLTTTSTTKHVHEPRRTGPSLNEEQQHRIALRAAKAMEKQIKRRHDQRVLFIWGDRKKASIKWFPGGTFEISVPQTLTPEQEHFEFPPRSRLLKKLATATAERKRVMQDDSNDQQDRVSAHRHQSSSRSSSRMKIMPTTMAQSSPPVPVTPTMRPDHEAIAEWFRQKTSTGTESGTKTNKRKKKTSVSTASSATTTTVTLSSPPQPTELRNNSTKRRARSTLSLLAPPPDESVHKHYVRLSLLRNENTLSHKLPKQQQGLVKLADVFHQKLHEQQRLAHHRQQQLRSSSSSSGMIALDSHAPTNVDNGKNCDTRRRSISTVNMIATPTGFYANRKLAHSAVNRSNKINDCTRDHANSYKKDPLPYLHQQHTIRPERSIPAYTR